MKRSILVFVVAAVVTGSAAVYAQGAGAKTAGTDAGPALEDARHAIEARLNQRGLKGATVAASQEKRLRRITISVRPASKSPRDDASGALTTAWQPVLQRVAAFDEITVRVGADYSVTCTRAAFADPTISLWGEGLTRTCRERKGQSR
jgi:hypothetical protein